jgi:hypothetical protein
LQLRHLDKLKIWQRVELNLGLDHWFVLNCILFLSHDKNPSLILVELELHGLAHKIIENSPDISQIMELCAGCEGSPVSNTRRLPNQGVFLASLVLL